MENNRHFSILVVGDNPDSILEKYNANLKVEPYVVCQFSKAGEYRNSALKYYEALANNESIASEIREVAKMKYEEISEQSDVDFYADITENYTIDQETGDAISEENPNTKFEWARLGKIFALPFIDNHGNEIYSGLKKEIDWEQTINNVADRRAYELAWDMIVDKTVEPKTEDELMIYENMKNRLDYFKSFGTKERYIASSCSFWCYAYVDKNGWVELTGNDSQIDWCSNFYKRFIEPIGKNQKISIYEAFRK